MTDIPIVTDGITPGAQEEMKPGMFTKFESVPTMSSKQRDVIDTISSQSQRSEQEQGTMGAGVGAQETSEEQGQQHFDTHSKREEEKSRDTESESTSEDFDSEEKEDEGRVGQHNTDIPGGIYETIPEGNAFKLAVESIHVPEYALLLNYDAWLSPLRSEYEISQLKPFDIDGPMSLVLEKKGQYPFSTFLPRDVLQHIERAIDQAIEDGTLDRCVMICMEHIFEQALVATETWEQASRPRSEEHNYCLAERVILEIVGRKDPERLDRALVSAMQNSQIIQNGLSAGGPSRFRAMIEMLRACFLTRRATLAAMDIVLNSAETPFPPQAEQFEEKVWPEVGEFIGKHATDVYHTTSPELWNRLNRLFLDKKHRFDIVSGSIQKNMSAGLNMQRKLMAQLLSKKPSMKRIKDMIPDSAEDAFFNLQTAMEAAGDKIGDIIRNILPKMELSKDKMKKLAEKFPEQASAIKKAMEQSLKEKAAAAATAATSKKRSQTVLIGSIVAGILLVSLPIVGLSIFRARS